MCILFILQVVNVISEFIFVKWINVMISLFLEFYILFYWDLYSPCFAILWTLINAGLLYFSSDLCSSTCVFWLVYFSTSVVTCVLFSSVGVVLFFDYCLHILRLQFQRYNFRLSVYYLFSYSSIFVVLSLYVTISELDHWDYVM